MYCSPCAVDSFCRFTLCVISLHMRGEVCTRVFKTRRIKVFVNSEPKDRKGNPQIMARNVCAYNAELTQNYS